MTAERTRVSAHACKHFYIFFDLIVTIAFFGLTVSVCYVERRNFAESLNSGPGRGTKRFLQHDAYNSNSVPHKIAKNHRLSSEGISHCSAAKAVFN